MQLSQKVTSAVMASCVPVEERKILHLGAGLKYDPNAVNVDLVEETKPDVVHDLDHTPWPFPADRFEGVLAHDVLEHLDDLVAVMEEIHRVCLPGAVLRLSVPHFSCVNAFTDITHRHFFSSASFGYFTGENELSFYSRCRFRRLRSQIVFYPTLLNRLVCRIANRFPTAYERRWAWLFPAWFLSVDLEVVK
jgi:SAM-dependent methyltransferase